MMVAPRRFPVTIFSMFAPDSALLARNLYRRKKFNTGDG